MTRRAFEVLKDLKGNSMMNVSRCLKKLTQLIDSKGYVRASGCKINKATNKSLIRCNISKWCAQRLGELRKKIHGSILWLAR